MIKLQLLLRHPSAEPALDPAVRARLEQHGFIVDGAGRASVTAHMTESAYQQLFAQQSSTQSAAPANAASELAVPPALQEDISLITCAPRHAITNRHPRVPHASI